MISHWAHLIHSYWCDKCSDDITEWRYYSHYYLLMTTVMRLLTFIYLNLMSPLFYEMTICWWPVFSRPLFDSILCWKEKSSPSHTLTRLLTRYSHSLIRFHSCWFIRLQSTMIHSDDSNCICDEPFSDDNSNYIAIHLHLSVVSTHWPMHIHLTDLVSTLFTLLISMHSDLTVLHSYSDPCISPFYSTAIASIYAFHLFLSMIFWDGDIQCWRYTFWNLWWKMIYLFIPIHWFIHSWRRHLTYLLFDCCDDVIPLEAIYSRPTFITILPVTLSIDIYHDYPRRPISFWWLPVQIP